MWYILFDAQDGRLMKSHSSRLIFEVARGRQEAKKHQTLIAPENSSIGTVFSDAFDGGSSVIYPPIRNPEYFSF